MPADHSAPYPLGMLHLLLISGALAAEPTDLPPFLRGDVYAGYRMSYQTGSLVEPVKGEEAKLTVTSPLSTMVTIAVAFVPS